MNRSPTAFCVLFAVWGCGCASKTNELAGIEARLDRIEAELQGLRAVEAAHDAASAAAPPVSKTLQDAVDVPVAASDADMTHAITLDVGDSQFFGDDSITITSIRSTDEHLKVGSSLAVKGHYKLHTHDKAWLLFSITSNKPTGHTWTPEGGDVELTAGEGDFELRRNLWVEGKPHLTFYAADGHPFGGIYFGEGEWLLKKKSWSYSP
jgi:hypothetical protein